MSWPPPSALLQLKARHHSKTQRSLSRRKSFYHFQKFGKRSKRWVSLHALIKAIPCCVQSDLAIKLLGGWSQSVDGKAQKASSLVP
eukprot:959830-Amphidinium_carterae.1